MNSSVKKYGFLTSIYRYAYYKIIVPIKREKRGAEYIARGTSVGIFFGLTPIVWQMNFVLLFWLVARKLKWAFSLPIALAFTWVSNTATNIPLFYLYYITGRILAGDTSFSSYDEFTQFFSNGILEGLKLLLKNWGQDIIIGSFFYMVICSSLGYFLAYRYAKRREEKLQQKSAERRKQAPD